MLAVLERIDARCRAFREQLRASFMSLLHGRTHNPFSHTSDGVTYPFVRLFHRVVNFRASHDGDGRRINKPADSCRRRWKKGGGGVKVGRGIAAASFAGRRL